MKMTIENKQQTIQEALQDPSLAHLHEAFRYALNTSFKDAFPKKYELSLIDKALDKTVKLFIENPCTPIKTVLATILDNLPDDIESPLLLKITRKTIEKWENLLASAQQKTQLSASA